MPGKVTFHPLQRAPRLLVVSDGDTVEIGRDPGCTFVLPDSRVSKRHARLAWNGSGWALEDLGSKNGTTVNGGPSTGQLLKDGDWISLGGLLGRFERLSAAQAANLESERLARIRTSADLRRRLTSDLEPLDLLLHLLQAAMVLTRTDRGFVLLVDPDGSLRPAAAAGFSSRHLEDERFRGSAGVVQQVLETRGPVATSDAQADPIFGRRASVVAEHIGSLACLPLQHLGAILGVLYVDSRGVAFTEPDLESLEALADHAASILSRASEAQRRRQAEEKDDEGLLSLLRHRLEELGVP